MKVYAIYKGDEFLYVGTAKECMKFFNVKRDTIYRWSSITNKREIKENKSKNRKCAFVLDED